MPRSRNTKRMNTFGAGRGCYITNAVRESDAYQCLSPSAKLVLLDFIRVYYHKSRGDSISIRGDGFQFTYLDCIEGMDHKTFVNGRRQVCEHGFFTKDASLKALIPGAADIYIPSSDWMRYKPTDSESARLDTQRRRRRNTLERSHQRKRKFIQGGRDRAE